MIRAYLGMLVGTLATYWSRNLPAEHRAVVWGLFALFLFVFVRWVLDRHRPDPRLSHGYLGRRLGDDPVPLGNQAARLAAEYRGIDGR